MAELSEADILRILDLIDKSSFDFFELTLGDVHLTVSKTGPPGEPAPPRPPNSGGVRARSESAPPTAPVGDPPASRGVVDDAPTAPRLAGRPGDAGVGEGAPPKDASAAAGLVPVLSPMVGTFYVAPAPDAPPFVQVGGTVEAGTTVGLVEAMKVFTSVLAGTPGTIAERVVDNAQFVEYGQTLFFVRPEV